MWAIRSAADRIAGTDRRVLIVGEPGTGKASLARYIHQASARAMRPFIHVDCGDVAARCGTARLVGALAQQRAGSGAAALLELARGGTLFLHHISGLAADLRQRLLSALLEDWMAAAGDARVLAACDSRGARPAASHRAGRP
jgi:DNA-binding NtrC family response regulator